MPFPPVNVLTTQTVRAVITALSCFVPFISMSFGSQIIHTFARRVQTKIKDLLQQMEEGLRTADPHDCSAYTGWTGENGVHD